MYLHKKTSTASQILSDTLLGLSFMKMTEIVFNHNQICGFLITVRLGKKIPSVKRASQMIPSNGFYGENFVICGRNKLLDPKQNQVYHYNAVLPSIGVPRRAINRKIIFTSVLFCQSINISYISS